MREEVAVGDIWMTVVADDERTWVDWTADRLDERGSHLGTPTSEAGPYIVETKLLTKRNVGVAKWSMRAEPPNGVSRDFGVEADLPAALGGDFRKRRRRKCSGPGVSGPEGWGRAPQAERKVRHADDGVRDLAGGAERGALQNPGAEAAVTATELEMLSAPACHVLRASRSTIHQPALLVDLHTSEAWTRVSAVEGRYAALQPIQDAATDWFTILGPDFARGICLRDDVGQYPEAETFGCITSLGTTDDPALSGPQTNRCPERRSGPSYMTVSTTYTSRSRPLHPPNGSFQRRADTKISAEGSSAFRLEVAA